MVSRVAKNNVGQGAREACQASAATEKEKGRTQCRAYRIVSIAIHQTMSARVTTRASESLENDYNDKPDVE